MAEVSIIANPPTTWEVTTLGDVCEENGGGIQTGPFGSQLHASDYVGVGIPSVMPVNIGDSRILTDGICRITETDARRLARYRLRSGDIVYSRRGDVERLALVREHEDGWLCGTGCLRVRFGKGKVDPLYASYYLGHPSVRQWVVQHAVGATMPNLNTGILSVLPFLCPPLPVQNAIADILGSLDDKIELNRKMNETLEAMARAVFRSWFVDFDPVVAKSEGRQPEGMDAETATLFPSSFEESEIGRVPKGWKVVVFSDIATLDRGVSYKGEFLSDAGCPMVNLGCFLGEGVFRRDKLKGYAGQYRPNNLVQAGDLLIANTDMTQNRIILGSPILLPVVPGEQPILFSHHVFAVRLRDDPSRRLQLYLYYCLLQSSFRERAEGYATGTTVLALPKDAVLGLPVLRPPDAVLSRFADLVLPLRRRIAENGLSDAVLTATRDLLLPRLLSGEVKTYGSFGGDTSA